VKPTRFVLIALIGLAVLHAQPAVAQDGGESAGRERVLFSKPDKPALTLAETVEFAIRHSPEIRRVEESYRLASARWQQASGVFDPTISVGPNVGYTQKPIAPFLRSRETDKRKLFSSVADSTAVMTRELWNVLRGWSTQPPACPPGFTFSSPALLMDRRHPSELAMLGISQDMPSLTADLSRAIGGLDLSSICSTPVQQVVVPEAFNHLWRQIDYSGNLGLEGILTSIAEIPRETRWLHAQVSETVAARARLALERLGPMPTDELLRNFGLEASLFKPFRSGLTLGGGFQMQSSEHNFRDRRMDPSFGGLEVAPQFPTAAAFMLDMPLGKGRGGVSVAAPERAAGLSHVAQREDVRHTVAREVFRAIVAYVNLMAAQQNQQFLEQSAARQQLLVELTRQQVEIGDVAAMELDRARARAAMVASALSGARFSVITARLSLAEAIGAEIDDLLDAPLARDGFPQALPPIPDLQALVLSAGTLRRDTRALDYVTQASAVLAAGARSDLRRRFDLSLTSGMRNVYESPFFRFLPDERNPIYSDFETFPPLVSPTRYYAPRGFYRSLSGRWEPFASAVLTLELPFANSAAKGRSAQAEAALRSSRIEASNQDRIVRENIVSTGGALREVAQAIERQKAVVGHSQEILESTIERLRLLEVTLLDALQTEEALTQDELELARMQQVFYSMLARLRYEAGELILFENEGTAAELPRFDPAGFVGR
jgi:outer membrane protein TolC